MYSRQVLFFIGCFAYNNLPFKYIGIIKVIKLINKKLLCSYYDMIIQLFGIVNNSINRGDILCDFYITISMYNGFIKKMSIYCFSITLSINVKIL